MTDPEHPPDENGTRDGTDLFYQEKIHHETRMGFLYQKLHRPRSYDYKKKSEKYKTWDDRLRMPQFAWANDPKAVEEVMTFVLGLTERKGCGQVPALDAHDAGQDGGCRRIEGLEPVQLRRLPRARDAQVHDRRGATVAEAFPNFKGNLRSSYTARANDYERASVRG